MTEADFTRVVLDLAKVLGWRSLHLRPATNVRGQWRTAVAGDGCGWPDLILVRGPQVIAAELKSEKGRVGLEQQQWLDALAAVPGIEAHVWRPADLESIRDRLQRR